MEKIKLSIANNRTTNELVGYWKSKDGENSIVVTAYAVDDLEKKFNKAVEKYNKQLEYSKNHNKVIENLSNNEENETQLMINSMKKEI